MLEKKDGKTIYPYDPESQAPAILIENGRVIDPVNDIDDTLTVAVKDGRIVSVGKEAPDGFSASSQTRPRPPCPPRPPAGTGRTP